MLYEKPALDKTPSSLIFIFSVSSFFLKGPIDFFFANLQAAIRSIFLTDVFYSLESNIHRSNKYLNMLGGEKPHKVMPKIHISKKEVLWARKK